MLLVMEWAARRLKPYLIFTASRFSIWPTTTSKKYRRYHILYYKYCWLYRLMLLLLLLLSHYIFVIV